MTELEEARERAKRTLDHWAKLTDPEYVKTIDTWTLLGDLCDEAAGRWDPQTISVIKNEIMRRAKENESDV